MGDMTALRDSRRGRSLRNGARVKRAAVSEVVSSVAMLIITMAVLGGLAALSLGSLRSANDLVASDSQNAVAEAGVLLTVVSTQSNSSGTYVWVFDYGWTPATLSSVYVNGGLVSGWSSSCNPLQVKDMCAVSLPPNTHGTVSILFGARSISLAL